MSFRSDRRFWRKYNGLFNRDPQGANVLVLPRSCAREIVDVDTFGGDFHKLIEATIQGSRRCNL